MYGPIFGRDTETNLRNGILLIGFGGIGQAVFAHARASAIPIAAVYVRPDRVDDTRAQVVDVPVVGSLEDLRLQPSLAVECASQGAVITLGPALLRRGVDLAVISTGALANQAVLSELEEAAKHGQSRMIVVPGAAPGVEALAAARLTGLDAVTYRLRKPPMAWLGTPAEKLVDLTRLSTAVEFYKGDARTVAQDYPKNANVAATIALAGVGFEKTDVTLIADPTAGGNINEIEARGSFGEMHVVIRGRPMPDNPRSAVLAASSVIRAVRNHFAHVIV